MAYIYDLADTWNNAAVTYTAIKMNVTDSASNASSLLMDLQVGGASKFKVFKNSSIEITNGNGQDAIWTGFGTSVFGSNVTSGSRTFACIALRASTNEISLRSTGLYCWTNSSNDALATIDLILARDAANILAQRNSTNAQTFRIYNTYTDSSNYERAKLEWSSNVLRIGTEKLGTGSARALELQTDGVTRLTISSTGNVSGKQIYTPTQTLTDGVTISWDALQSAAAEVTLTGSGRTITPSNLVAGGTYLLFVKQDATGGRTVTTWTNFRWPGGFAPTLSTAANAVDIITGVSDGTYIYASAQTGFA